MSIHAALRTLTLVVSAALWLSPVPGSAEDYNVGFLTFWDNYQKESGENSTCYIPLPSGTGDGWNSTNCPAGHKTHNLGINFDHFHMPALGFPVANAMDKNTFASFTLQRAAIDCYYDWKYGYPTLHNENPQVGKTGEVDTSKNCHTYAFGRAELLNNSGNGAAWGGFWVNDSNPNNGASTIYGVDYTTATTPAEGLIGAFPNSLAPSHSWVVEDVATIGSGGSPKIVGTSEKFRCSAVYVMTYTEGNSLSYTSTLKKIAY